MILEINNLSKKYGDKKALNNSRVNLQKEYMVY